MFCQTIQVVRRRTTCPAVHIDIDVHALAVPGVETIVAIAVVTRIEKSAQGKAGIVEAKVNIGFQEEAIMHLLYPGAHLRGDVVGSPAEWVVVVGFYELSRSTYS